MSFGLFFLLLFFIVAFIAKITAKLSFMKKTKLTCNMLLLSCVCFFTSNAQEAVVAAGSSGSGNGGTLSYSVGQVAYETATSSDGSLSEGVQQVYDISVESSADEASVTEIIAYPNPFTDYIILSVESLEKVPGFYFATVADNNGRVIHNYKITDSETEIDLSDEAMGIYFLKVFKESNGKTEVINYKIQKNH